VVAAPEEYLVGLALPGAGIVNAPFWPGGRPDIETGERYVSRSALKLCEALRLFSIQVPEHGAALDLGAAPGGWSQVLAGCGMQVTAVDPAFLDPRVARLQAVRAFHGTAQAFIRAGDDQFDLLVDDMRLDARESSRLALALRPRLRSRAAVLVTLKLPEHAPTGTLKAALTTLSRSYEVLGARCLYFNRNEVTVYARVPDNSSSTRSRCIPGRS
jgi:23S rRNA (cytidine2498-2'-O)-methyltransferase